MRRPHVKQSIHSWLHVQRKIIFCGDRIKCKRYIAQISCKLLNRHFNLISIQGNPLLCATVVIFENKTKWQLDRVKPFFCVWPLWYFIPRYFIDVFLTSPFFASDLWAFFFSENRNWKLTMISFINKLNWISWLEFRPGWLTSRLSYGQKLVYHERA